MKACILIISPEPWEGHFVSKHHYAITLARQGYHVYFLDPPDTSLSEIQVNSTKYTNLWSVTGPRVAKGLRFYPSFLKRWMEVQWLKKLEKRMGTVFSVIWLFENSRFYDMRFAGAKLKIYHQVDWNQDFHVTQAASSADICFCTTDVIRRKLIEYNERVYNIHHGVSSPSTVLPLNEEQKVCFRVSTINAVYVGNLDIPYLNIDLLAEIVQDFPTVRFHFIGKYSKEGMLYNRLGKSSNIVWWGVVPSSQIPTILSYCDIQLLAYKVESDWEKEQMASPHKVMEYLASGKVIVATYTDEYKDKPRLLEMVTDNKDYIPTFRKIVSNLDYYNSPQKQQERIDFTKNNTYEKQLEKIRQLIKNNNLGEF
jgi:glycosyltransferase involved in cell wall biosynthesis